MCPHFAKINFVPVPKLKISKKDDNTNFIIPVFFVLIGIGAIIPFVLRRIDKKRCDNN